MEITPSSPGRAAILAKIAAVNRDRQPALPDFCKQVREVVLIASSSRGGSSIFSEILRQSPELLHFQGEINPFLTIAGLNYPESGEDSDQLGAGQPVEKMARLAHELALEVGVTGPVDLRNPLAYERFRHDLLWRLSGQWPETAFDPGFLERMLEQTLSILENEHGWPPGSFLDPQLFHILFLAAARSRYPEINPYYYDLRHDLIQRYCPEAVISLAPPSRIVIEESPYILITPRQAVTAEMAATRPLVIKTPGNVYRLPFLRQLFPQARLRIIHLVRNPADSISGLYDGWQYHGFFAHHLRHALAIKGYSDRFPEWGSHWWKYDLPPGWQAWREQPLEYLCGYQWRAAHAAILAGMEENPATRLRLKFEELIGPLALRRQRFSELAAWLGIRGEELLATVSRELPPVMATTTLPPRQRRWFAKVELLRPVLTDPRLGIVTLAHRLGYNLEEEIGG